MEPSILVIDDEQAIPVINTKILYLVHVASYFSGRILVSDHYVSLEDDVIKQFEKDWVN